MEITNSENQLNNLSERLKIVFQPDEAVCPVKDILIPVLDKWSLSAMLYLSLQRVTRFNELKKTIPGISARMLTLSLKKLEQVGFIRRDIYPSVPPKVEYSLTELGIEFINKILDLSEWINERKEVIIKGRGNI